MGVLDGQVAIMTGGGTGIGRAAALMLAAEGAQVVVAGRRKAPIETVVGEIASGGRPRGGARRRRGEARGGAARSAEWTVSPVRPRRRARQQRGPLAASARNVRWVEQDDWDAVVAVNLTGVYALTQAVLPSMIERGGGTIVTVSSLAALKPGLIGGAPYGAAKAGVRNLMGHVHTVLRDKGIRATTIMPAEVDTPILDNRPLPPDAEARATMMHAEDVAHAILLCVTLPARTVIEEIVMSPTILRDQSADIRTARDLGATPGAR